MNDTPGEAPFEAKVRFAREVEAHLASPELPAAPFLLLRIQERVMREQLRRARRSELRRAGTLGAALLAAWGVVGVFASVPFSERLGLIIQISPIQAFLKATALGISSPVETLTSLGGVAMWTLAAVLGGVLAYLVRDLFLDPFQGLPFRGSIRR